MTYARRMHAWHMSYALFLHGICLTYACVARGCVHDACMRVNQAHKAVTVSFRSLPLARPLGHYPSDISSVPPLDCFGVALSGPLDDWLSSPLPTLLLE